MKQSNFLYRFLFFGLVFIFIPLVYINAVNSGFGILRISNIPANFNGTTTVNVTVSGTDTFGDSTITSNTITLNIAPDSTPPPVSFTLTLSRGGGSGSGTVVVSANGSSVTPTLNPNYTASYTSGTQVTLVASPDSSSDFVGWGGSCSGTGGCELTMSGNKAVTATFDKKQGNLTVSKSGDGTGSIASTNIAGISCGTSCASNYDFGTGVILAATPSGNSTFSGWGGSCSGTGGCELTISNPLTQVSATFSNGSSSQVNLSVSKTGTGTGVITSNPSGIDCGSTCSKDYSSNSNNNSVALTATASPGSTFAGWTQNSSNCAGTTLTPCTLIMNSNKAMTAIFNLANRTLTVSKLHAGSGTVASNPAGINCGTGAGCTASYPNNTSVTLTVTPAIGSTFGGWGEACQSSGTTANYCILAMNDDKTVTATFDSDNPSPVASISANPASVNSGGSSTITWSCANSTSGSVSPSNWTGLSGSQSTGVLTSPRTYTLTCAKAGFANATQNVTVSIGTSSSFSCSPTTQNVLVGNNITLTANGGGSTYLWSAPGSGFTLGSNKTFNTYYGTSGTKTITVTSGGVSSSCSVVVTSLPTSGSMSDLVITDFHLTDLAGNTKSAFLRGDEIYPSVTIQNQGSNETGVLNGGFYISIYSNSGGTGNIGSGLPSDIDVWVKESGSIPAGSFKTYSITTNSASWTNDNGNKNNWKMTSNGAYYARAFVDSFNYIVESNENNNQKGFSYTIGPVKPNPPIVALESPVFINPLDSVSGNIQIKGYAVPDPSTSIKKIEFWTESNPKLVASSSSSSSHYVASFFPASRSDLTQYSSNPAFPLIGFSYPNFNTASLNDGPHNLVIKAYDNANNLTTISASFTATNGNFSATLQANPDSIFKGESSTLTWSVANPPSVQCSSSTIPGFDSQLGNTNGNMSVKPASTTTYRIDCVNADGEASASGEATVTVKRRPGFIEN